MGNDVTMMMLFPQTLRHAVASLGAEGDDLMRPPLFYYSTLTQGMYVQQCSVQIRQFLAHAQSKHCKC